MVRPAPASAEPNVVDHDGVLHASRLRSSLAVHCLSLVASHAGPAGPESRGARLHLAGDRHISAVGSGFQEDFAVLMRRSRRARALGNAECQGRLLLDDARRHWVTRHPSPPNQVGDVCPGGNGVRCAMLGTVPSLAANTRIRRPGGAGFVWSRRMELVITEVPNSR